MTQRNPKDLKTKKHMNEQIKFEEVVAFAKTNAWWIVLRGVISLAFVAGLLALYYAFAPRSESYKAEVHVTLESRDGVQTYPNGDPFGFRDIISAPVMNKVWTKYEFDKKGVKFEDFCTWFSIVAYDKERAKIDAEFQGKMSKRNITVPELNALQREYETKLAALASNRFALTVRPEALLDRDTTAQLLADIPETWFSEYATIKAPQIPAVVSVDAIRTYIERSKAGGGRSLELIDTIRKYLAELKATCAFVREEIMRGRNARTDGMDLGTYESQLDVLSAEVLRLKNQMLKQGGESDLGDYVSARQDELACETLELDERVVAVRQTLELIGEGRKGAAASGGDRQAPVTEPAPFALQADSGFFADFTSMVRRDANLELVKKYTQELTGLRAKQAEIAARKLYYDQISKYVQSNAAKAASAKTGDAVFGAIDGFAQELLDVGGKIVVFRDRCLALYRTSDQFYVIAEPAAYAKSFKFTLPRFALGLLALWFLYNLVGLVRLWNRE